MEIVRYKYIFVTIIFLSTPISTEKADMKGKNSHNAATCPYSKIIEDIFKVNNKSAHTPISNSERAKLFLHSIAKVTESNEEISQEELVNDIIAAINRIKNNITTESDNETRLNEAIVLNPKNNNVTDEPNKPKNIVQIKSGIEDKTDKHANSHNTTKPNTNKTIAHDFTTEKTNYVEVLTIEPNNTQKSNISSHNIIEVLKHLMPMFNSTLTKELHNITIIERNFNKNHSFSATKNVSTIVVTYCDKDNSSKTNITFESGKETGFKELDNKNDEDYEETETETEDTADDEVEGDMDMTVGEKKDILEAAEYGMQKMHELYSVLEPKLYSMGLWLDDTNPARYVAAFNAPSEDSARFTRYGYASLQAATKLKELISSCSKNFLVMKYFIAFSAVILAASAMPTEIGKEDVVMPMEFDNDAATFNATRNTGLAGFATLNGGTRGGQGGATWTVWDAWALRDASGGNAARIINVRGRIDLTPLFTASPGVRISVGSWKTFIGGDANAMIFGGGLVFSGIQQVIVQNIKFHNALSYAPGERPNGSGGIISMVPGEFSEIDNIDITTSTNIWVDHCEFADDPWNSASLAASQRRHDGLIDIKRAANWITISNNIFRNHNHVMLVGHADNNAAQDVGRLKVTYYLNWFQGTNQRNPRVRFGEVHILNNLYTDITSYGIGLGVAAQVYAERNVFVNTRRAWGWAAGVPSPLGHLFNFNNLLINSGHDTGITGGGVNWRPNQYYSHNPMANTAVEAHVRRHAGTW